MNDARLRENDAFSAIISVVTLPEVEYTQRRLLISVDFVPVNLTENAVTAKGFNAQSAFTLTEARTIFFSPQLTSPERLSTETETSSISFGAFTLIAKSTTQPPFDVI